MVKEMIFKIYRQQYLVKFVYLLDGTYLFPNLEGKKLVDSRFFLSSSRRKNSKTVQCVQYLIWMYLPCLAVNQILL